MVTNKERCDVARRLRELEIGVIGTVIPTTELVKNILKVIDYSHSNAMTPYGLLADLIEPDSTMPTDHGEADIAFVEGFIQEMRHSTKEEQNEYSTMLEKMSTELYPVDRDALLALADKLKKESWKLQDEFMRTGIERYGYELAIAQQDDWIADCILEACGKYNLNGKE